jgi:hypothetical protein
MESISRLIVTTPILLHALNIVFEGHNVHHIPMLMHVLFSGGKDSPTKDGGKLGLYALTLLYIFVPHTHLDPAYRGTFKKKDGGLLPRPSFLKNRKIFDPAEQSAKAERQLPQILPLCKAN